MKLCLYTDPHWCVKSVILTQRGEKYSRRLENLINSVNWVQQLANESKCDAIVCLGDFFNGPSLQAEEITALNEINWSPIEQMFLLGNHEIFNFMKTFNSIEIFKSLDFSLFDEIKLYQIGDTEIVFLPYIFEENRKSLSELLPEKKTSKRVIFSHNDIQAQYGQFCSKIGFTIEDIENNCDLFINGHIHNCGWISQKILNLGNLTGLDFKEDIFKYGHYAAILDTDTLEIKFYSNPYALGFAKLDINSEQDFSIIETKPNPLVLSIRVPDYLVNNLRTYLNSKSNVLAHKETIIFTNSKKLQESSKVSIVKEDYLQKLFDFCIDRIGKSDILTEELSHICKR